VPPTAIDLDRGFLLTPDQGPVFGETVGDDLEPWCAMAREGALLQRELAEHVDEMQAAGLRRLGAAEAVSYVATRAQQYESLPASDPRQLSAADATTLRGLLPQVRVWAEETAALGLPVTLNHNDLHENNVFAVDGGMRFFDFGDALLGDPLAALLVPLRRVTGRLECGPDDPRVSQVAEAAFEVWSDVASLADLRHGLDASLQLGKLARSESWLRCLSHLTDDETAEFGAAEGYWLLALAEPPLLTS
jgi:Ser/Thr protein kinase RdoA (MazF antagonist)